MFLFSVKPLKSPGAVFGVYGHAVAVAATGGAAAAGSLGGDLSITGDTLRIASAIVLPSGRISLAARGAATATLQFATATETALATSAETTETSP